MRASLDTIAASPFIPHKDSIRGYVYEVETGELREVS
jgi:carbonic anhydrase